MAQSIELKQMFKGGKMKKILAGFGLLLSMISSTIYSLENTDANFEHAVWNGIPIKFSVSVGEERIIKFPGSVVLKSIDKLKSDSVKILNNGGYIYIKALKPFSETRCAFIYRSTGQVVLVDISGESSAPSKPLSIVLEGPQEKPQNSQVNKTDVSMVDLMRFAIKKLYQPERLQDSEASIHRSPMNTAKSVHLLSSDNLMAMPLASWSNGREYVTAVLIKNTDTRSHFVDPRRIRGSFRAASLYPINRLQRSGSTKDRTTLFLVSSRPFNDALNSIKEYRP